MKRKGKKILVAAVAGMTATHSPSRGSITASYRLSGSAKGGGGRRGSESRRYCLSKVVWVSQVVGQLDTSFTAFLRRAGRHSTSSK